MQDQRSLLAQFLRFSSATVASLMVFSLYSIVDGLFVAKGVGDYAMAAVNLAVPFTNVMFSIAVTFAVGTSTILSIYLGQGNREHANRLFSQNLVLLVIIGLTITALVLVFLEPFALLLGAEEETLGYTMSYLRGLAPFATCFIVSYNLEILVKTDGRPMLAILTVCIGCLTNCVLDYVAIFVLNWGAWGAAFATGLSQLLTCIIYVTHFFGKHTTFHLVRFRPEGSIYRRLIPIGLADGVTELCNGVMIFLFNHVILRCIGTDGLVSYTIIAYTNTLVVNIMLGVSQGSQPLVSFQYGRKDPEKYRRLLRYGLITVAIMTAVCFAGIFLLAPQLGTYLPRLREASAERRLHRGAAAVRSIVSASGLQHPHGRLPDGGGAAPLRPVHLHGPGTGAAGRGAAPAGGALGRQQHLVRPPLLGAAVFCHGIDPHAPFPPGHGGINAAAKTFEKLLPI